MENPLWEVRWVIRHFSKIRDGRPIFFVGGYYAAADYDDGTDSWKIVESTLSHSSFDTDWKCWLKIEARERKWWNSTWRLSEAGYEDSDWAIVSSERRHTRIFALTVWNV